MECRTRLMDDVTVVPWTDTGDVLGVPCITNKGLLCRNSDQIGNHTCRDYELRFLCPPGKIGLNPALFPANPGSNLFEEYWVISFYLRRLGLFSCMKRRPGYTLWWEYVPCIIIVR